MNVSRLPVRRQSERGFTLIELGIVIAVIAVLASVVLYGRGFVLSARISKVTEAVNSVEKGVKTYAGQFGGTLPASTSLLPLLEARKLLPGGDNWSPVPEWYFKDAASAAGANSQQWVLQVQCPTNENCADLWDAKSSAKGTFVDSGSVGGKTCTKPTGSTTVYLCFNL